VIGEPPSLAGAVNVIVACAFPGAADVMVGAPGTVLGVTDTGEDALPVPAALVAATVHEYAVPLASPVTVIGATEELVPVNAPGEHVAV
jgi:hypothetical protein